MHTINPENGNTLEYPNIGSNLNRTTRFVLHKTISFYWPSDAKKCADNLNELKKHTFGEILIPPFLFSLEDKVVHMEIEYVKGTHIDVNSMKIVYKECVLKKGFSITNYTHTNFIKENGTGKIYYVDIEDVGYEDIEKRKKRFRNHLKTAPIVRYPHSSKS